MMWPGETEGDPNAHPRAFRGVSAADSAACVDVLIAVYNDATTIEKAVLSALSDAHVDRVIVVDDGSTDGTPSVLKCLREQVGDRLAFQRLEPNKGPSVARNRGIELSTAPWIAILDGDDYFLPNRIKDLLKASDGADFVADDQIQINEGREDDPTSSREFLVGHETTITLDLSTFVARNLSNRARQRKEFGFLKPMMRRSFLDVNQLRYDESLRLGEDFVLYARALAAGAAFKVIPSRKYVSAIRSDSMSGLHSKRELEHLRDASKAFEQLPKLTAAERMLIRRHHESIDTRIQWLNVIDAVKARRVAAFLSPFFIRWTTSVFLVSRLWEQLVVRSKKSLGLQEATDC
jgi:succinoglycan biosynthesis protein ExoU